MTSVYPLKSVQDIPSVQSHLQAIAGSILKEFPEWLAPLTEKALIEIRDGLDSPYSGFTVNFQVMEHTFRLEIRYHYMSGDHQEAVRDPSNENLYFLAGAHVLVQLPNTDRIDPTMACGLLSSFLRLSTFANQLHQDHCMLACQLFQTRAEELAKLSVAHLKTLVENNRKGLRVGGSRRVEWSVLVPGTYTHVTPDGRRYRVTAPEDSLEAVLTRTS